MGKKIIIFVLLMVVVLFWSFNFNYAQQDTKQPNVAGTFYPASKEELSFTIDNFLENAKPVVLEKEIFALIVPHAGYDYSAGIAAYGYKLIKGKPYKTVIIIGPAHYYGFKGISVYPKGKFLIPLGEIEIDSDFAEKLLNKDKDIFFEPLAFDKEHSIEVQLPFLKKTLSDFKIVPILMGEVSLSLCQKLAYLLKEAIGQRKDVLLVVSTDMYHGYDYETCALVDNLTLSYLKNMDAEGLYEGLATHKLQLCGGWAAVAALILSKEMGHNKLEVLKYSNSAEITGKKIKGIWTVGYSSCAIDTDKEEGMLNKQQKKRLLEIARRAIETYLETQKKLEITENDPLLFQNMGAFVTLHKNGQLRGCIGNLVADKPLYRTVIDMAIESAVGDLRFLPLTKDELKEVEIEISVLSPLKKIDDPQQIILGKHGVLVSKGFRSGVFLPQVAKETGWSKEEFLSYLCSHKAGLAPLAWKDKDTELYIFTAEVFSEKDLRD